MTDTSKKRMVNHSRAVRLAALGGVIGPILFAVLVIVGGVVYDGYSHVSQKISELGGVAAEFAIIQNMNFIIMGLSILAFAWALARVFGPPYLGPALIAFFGVFTNLIAALLPCDAGCLGKTTVGLFHNVTGLSGFIAVIVGMFMLARRWRDDPAWQPHARFTGGLASLAAASLAWFTATQALDEQSFSGVAQRIFAVAVVVWIITTAWKMYRQLEPDKAAHR